jgi:hypothetical protein
MGVRVSIIEGARQGDAGDGLGNVPDGQIPHTPQNHLTKNASYLKSCQNHKSASSTGTYAVRYVLGMLWSMQDSGAF